MTYVNHVNVITRANANDNAALIAFCKFHVYVVLYTVYHVSLTPMWHFVLAQIELEILSMAESLQNRQDSHTLSPPPQLVTG